MRVVCAMSGGVDSTVAAALMIEAGYEVIGMTMRLYDAKMTPKTGRGGTCCSPAEVERAKHVCDLLGIAHYVVDESARFERDVMNDFAREYAQGYTPNPCVRCNQSVKFRPLLARAHALGASQLVTGHYAKVIDGRLFRAQQTELTQRF